MNCIWGDLIWGGGVVLGGEGLILGSGGLIAFAHQASNLKKVLQSVLEYWQDVSAGAEVLGWGGLSPGSEPSVVPPPHPPPRCWARRWQSITSPMWSWQPNVPTRSSWADWCDWCWAVLSAARGGKVGGGGDGGGGGVMGG